MDFPVESDDTDTPGSSPPAASSQRRWVLAWAGACALGLALAGGVNLVVDPYGVHGLVESPGLNQLKPEFAGHMRLGKAYAVVQLRPTAVVLGTSQALVGLDPAYAAWPEQAVYNLALNGVNAYEAWRFFQHAHATQPLKLVVLVLDPQMFRADEPTKLTFDDRVLNTPGRDRWLGRVLGQVRLALSLDALLGSARTVWVQHGAPPGYRAIIRADAVRDDGFQDMVGYEEEVRHGGGAHRQFYDRVRLRDPSQADPRFVDAASGESTFSYLASIVRVCHRDGVDLRLVLAPRHVAGWRREELEWTGEWKREVLQTVCSVAGEASAAPFPVWDFNYVNPFTTEPVPAAGDLVSLPRWFWDPSHFRRELGEVILDRVFGVPRQDPDQQAFGVLLAPDSLEEHLARIAREWPE
jgi:hypothetical protein